MRVVVVLENRFFRNRSGEYYSNTTFDYTFWQKYLMVFDEVYICARVKHVDEYLCDRKPASGPGIKFIELPYYVGLKPFFLNYLSLKNAIKNALIPNSSHILRAPGVLIGLAWSELRKRQMPYGIEVVGDPWDVFSPGSVKTVLRPIIRRRATKMLRRQCEDAYAASYVTEYSLQKRYPCKNWSTFYSSIDLENSSVLSKEQVELKLDNLKRRMASHETIRLCHVGMMEHLYKAQDVLIKAFADCVVKIPNLELSFVGSGVFQKDLEKLAQDYSVQDKVKFMGKANSKDEVFDLLDQSDIYVLPSRQEGLPRTVIEAMARGLPCISSTAGGIPELISHQQLVEPNDVKGLATKIYELANDFDVLSSESYKNADKAGQYVKTVLDKRRKQFYITVAQASKAWNNPRGSCESTP